MSPEQQRIIKDAAAGLSPMRYQDGRCIGCQNRIGVGHDAGCWVNNLLLLAWEETEWSGNMATGT